MFRTLIAAGAALISASGLAADLGYKKPAPVAATAVSGPCLEKKGLAPDAFGFASGTDVADLDSWGGGLDNVATRGARGGSAFGYNGVAQVSTSFLPCLEVGPYVSYSLGRSKPYGEQGASGSILGAGLEVKYKVLGRATHGIGMTLAASPNFGGYNGKDFYGGNGTVFGNSYRLLLDAELLKDKLYGALNLELSQSAFRDNDKVLDPIPNTSQFNLRGALSYAITDSFFIGAEANWQVQREGMWLNRSFLGAAAYVGPHFLWAIDDKWTLNGAFQTQIAGTDKSGPGHKLGTAVFPLNQGRLKLAYSF